MLIAVYDCANLLALRELVTHLDTGESISANETSYTVVYKSPRLTSVAADPDISGLTVKSQVYVATV